MPIKPDVSHLLQTAWITGGASEEMIRAAENDLGVTFPPSYRQFLSQYGAVVCEKVAIAGLLVNEDKDEPPLWSDVRIDSRQLRRVSRGMIPDEYIPIASDGTEYTFYLDTGQADESGECPVIVLGPGADGIVVASDVFDFIIRSFEDRLEY